MSILDQMIDNLAAPRVVSEQHDIGRINAGDAPPPSELPSAGLRRQIESLKGPEFWDEAEYGIRRETQVAELEKAFARAVEFEKSPEGVAKAAAEAERVMSEMRARAINRAGLDTSNGRVNVMVAG
jgi:hypothetical protein